MISDNMVIWACARCGVRFEVSRTRRLHSRFCPECVILRHSEVEAREAIYINGRKI